VFLAGCEIEGFSSEFSFENPEQCYKHFELKRSEYVYDLPKGILLFKTLFFRYGEHLTKNRKIVFCFNVLFFGFIAPNYYWQ